VIQGEIIAVEEYFSADMSPYCSLMFVQ